MAFDFSAGLANAGEAVAKTAGAWTLEAQKSALEMDKVKLADELAGKRESAGRQEQGLINAVAVEKAQIFKGSESEKDRATQLQGHQISAGATIRAQQIAADARLKEIETTDRFHRDQLEVNKGLKELELKTPGVRAFEERDKMTPEKREEFDKYTNAQKEPKTPYRFNANEGNPVIFNEQTGEVKSGVPAGGPTAGGKRLETGERKELKSMADPAIALTDLTNKFKPAYGGALTESLGNAVNAYGREFSGATPDLKERAAWWQQYQRFSNIEQHELYGAALSAREQQNFKAAMVTPNMQPAMIASNLKTQQDIALTALARYSTSLLKDGYKPDSIEAITGLRFYGNDANYNSFPPGTVYIAPTGKVMRKQAAAGNL